jgi:uncharacterized repeat protein (TIGR02543 family)
MTIIKLKDSFKVSKWGRLLVLAMLLSVAGMASLLPAAAADQNPVLAVGTVNATAGETVQVPVSLTSAGQVTSVQFDLSYDTSLLTYQGKTAGSLTAGYVIATNVLSGKVRVIIYSPVSALITAGAGTVVNLQFQVAGTATGGQGCALGLSGVSLADANGDGIATTTTNGQFQVLALTADSTDSTLGHDITLSFVDNAAWRAAISGISVNGAALDSSQYTIGAGAITIRSSAFPSAGYYTIVVSAAGYSDCTVLQPIRGSIVSGLAVGSTAVIAGNGSRGYSGDGGAAVNAAFGRDIYGMAVDAATGDLYIADTANNVVRKVDTRGMVTTVAGTGTAGYNGDSITATTAELNQPYDVAVDGAGNLYICDRANARIRKVSRDGIITTVAGTGTAGYAGDGGPAVNAKISNWAVSIALDKAGNIYIADQQYLRKINTSGVISTVATDDSFYFADGIAVDSAGNIYAAQDEANRVLKISPTGAVTTVAGTGDDGEFYNGDIGDGGPATAAVLSWPSDVAVDAAGNLYIADGNDMCIRKVDSTGTITTICNSIGYTQSLAVDAGGNLYAFGDNYKIYYIQVAGLTAPPALTADDTDNTVGQAVYLTFTDDSAWRNAISGITVDGTALAGSQYTVAPGQIGLAAGVFTEPGDYSITVAANGYSDAAVTQTMQKAVVPAGCTVTFDSNGGSDVTSATVSAGETLAEPPDPAKAGCTFLGWYTDSELNTPFSFSTPVTSDMTLYAAWSNNAGTESFPILLAPPSYFER